MPAAAHLELPSTRAARLSARAVRALALQEVEWLPLNPFLEAAARHVGVASIARSGTLKGSGAMGRARDGTYRLLINLAEPLDRQHFTIAHELGHAALGLTAQSCDADDRTERLCDIFATELLAPADEFANVFRERLSAGPASALWSIARTMVLSLTFCVNRVAELGLLANSQAAVALGYRNEGGNKVTPWTGDIDFYGSIEETLWTQLLAKQSKEASSSAGCQLIEREMRFHSLQQRRYTPIRLQLVLDDESNRIVIGISPLAWSPEAKSRIQLS